MSNKLLLLCCALLCSATLTLNSCKKEATESVQVQTAQGQTTSSVLNSARQVNSWGFLTFDDIAEVEHLADSLTTITHVQAKAFCAGVGFTPKALSLYNESLDAQTVSVSQAPNYLISEDATVQIQGVVMKLTDDENFVITLTGTNIAADNYQKLARGDYSSSAMNRFGAGNSSISLSSGFFDFNNNNPTGHDEPEPRGCYALSVRV